MAGIIHFGSGKTLEITEIEFSRMGPKLNAKGIRTQVTSAGHLIPLNSSTMEFIERVEEEPEESVSDTIIREEVENAPQHFVVPVQEESLEKPKSKTPDELLAEMTAKSSCKHEPEKLELYLQHTAKGIRYFPVCSFCGKRERYVSESKINKGEYAGTVNERWTDTDIAGAKSWIEK